MNEKFIKKGIMYEYPNSHYKIVFTNVEAGNMAYQAYGENVLENRQNVADTLDIDIEKFIFARQCHSSQIAKVSSLEAGRGVYSFEDGIGDVDGLYTFDNDVILCAFYADCTPVYIMSEKHNLSCVVHAGWQGTVKAITYKTIEQFKQLGIDPEDLDVVIGPSISYQNFEVEKDVIELIEKLEMIETNLCYTQINDIKYKADVKLINKLQAIAAGVPEVNVYTSQICTVDDENLFSYRQKNETGRMIACIFKK